MFSKLDIDDERDREKDVSNLSTRPVVRIECELVVDRSKGARKKNVWKKLYRLDIDLEMCQIYW